MRASPTGGSETGGRTLAGDHPIGRRRRQGGGSLGGLRLWSCLPALGASLISVGLVASPSRASSLPNWYEVRIVAGPNGAAVYTNAQSDVVGDPAAPGPEFWGAGGTDYKGMMVRPINNGDLSFSTTGSLGGLDLVVTPGQNGNGRFFTGAGTYVPPNQTGLFIEFVTDAAFSDLVVSNSVQSGSAAITTLTGTGASDISMARPEDNGAAAQIGGVAAGLSTDSATTQEGLVGAFWPNACEGMCYFQAQAPDGPANGSVPSGGWPFAGPAGSWNWTYGGLGSAWVGAWAPIGDDWRLVRAAEGYSQAIVS